MTKIICEKCGKEFNCKSYYNQHQKRKTPCVNDSKIKGLVNELVEENLLTKCLLVVIQPTNKITIETSTFDEIKKYYDETLNTDKATYKSSNDEPTPIDCVIEMISKIPSELWSKNDLAILDPCCGNGNFFVPIIFELLKYYDKQTILERILEFNDINENRLQNVRDVFCGEKYNLQITNRDFIAFNSSKKYDLIVANPPYAKLLENGKRASKNHNLIKDFIEKALSQLKPNGYLLFITPDNWMSYADRNVLIETITTLQIIHLDIHTAKKYFKKIGSSFTWYVIQNCAFYKNINVSGIWKKKEYVSSVVSKPRKYIPLLYNQTVQNILSKTIDNITVPKFEVKTSSNLHKYTKAELIRNEKTEEFKYKLIHTPSQTVYSSRPHKYQEGYKVFISTTDKYSVFIDNCGMTQSIVFILCTDEEQANKYLQILQHPLYVFINNICRWGNFNNIRILQSFPIPTIEYYGNHKEIYDHFNITNDEIEYIFANV
ncbi:MAG: class I SAM-dependent methyltransferase [Crocinitomicaceae bacterium]|nr:class I SAM-dependent methyltransferase [Crocinitomicaceae bacterium]